MKPYFLKITMGILVTMFSLIQMGCIVGLSTGNPGLAAGGATMAVAGEVAARNSYYVVYPVGPGGATRPAMSAVEGGSWLLACFVEIVGIALDEQNPGRQVALNMLPLDESVAKELGVMVSDLQNYNDELSQVISVNTEIENTLKIAEFGSLDLNQVASQLGFESDEKLIEVFEKEALDVNDLNRFSTLFDLTPKTAGLYLKIRWNINIH